MPKKTKCGIVQSFNISPKGTYEGLLLKSDEELVQINFPQEWAETITIVASPGNYIEAEIEPHDEHANASHPVYRLRNLLEDKSGKVPNQQLRGQEHGHFSGKVERLNYALHGEVNGAILDSGDFLHLKPHGAVAVGLTHGMNVKGKGSTKPMVAGHYVIEAEEVNGIRLEKKPKKAHS